ncbi:choice-of-anchor D domain-containing protein [Leptospira sp. 2 VSF19]|uniref:Choice-of-anchor D domain-containing protein n=1 Tax=Leptospira soteropolitanensis TaxID=2950025 RepID=A0AAW5VMW2_9LEPT|nr:choice-of-anchor D domain-containing protein [Leptospira soteropolitanensis]MCW7492464.1 choice-of-anchor D domain-containing protein [Leptospira soteropolitanensis]MCW7500515.1 choice-of-anchor D domain-containing protein [Leptospira soteropolitanensis]MCW7522815.1 choice-of-anchor D domain-containing protein [Leptospira soteropolitanensis]MCW7526674.1 choice-of-anchor D domain-containing protein [Leptospira soteropolitanensis]MCW7530485.1 choice-of-anchor D domain-containing protein [Lept
MRNLPINQNLNLLIFLTLIPLLTIGCPGGGGGGGGAAFALMGLGGGGGGDVPAPKLEVLYEGVSRESGSTLDIGSEPVNTADGKTGTITIKNSGTAAITLSGSPNIVTLSGTDASQFSVTQPATSSLAAGASAIFTINFKPTGVAGTRSATIKMNSSDPAVGSFQLNLTGEAGVGVFRLGVSVSATQISSNGSFAMGSVEEQSVGTPVTFTVRNTGSFVVNLDSPAVTSSNARFIVNQTSFTGSLAIGQSKTFTIGFSPLVSGAEESNIAILYDGAASFLYKVTATATVKPVPTISISHNSSSFTTGGSIPNFGVVWPPEVAGAKTVTITNSGTATMTGISISKLGTDPDQFTVSAFSAGTSLAPGASGTFTIQFVPTLHGEKNAIVRVQTANGSNGSASSSDLAVVGTGRTGVDVLVTWSATNEKAVNDTDGGYNVCYSKTSNFTAVPIANSIFCVAVPNVGGNTPTSKTISVPSYGTWYFKVYSYGKYNTTGGLPSTQVSVVVPQS